MTAKLQRHTRMPRGPFARLVDVKSVSDAGVHLTIEATPDECAAIASETDLPALPSLTARLAILRRAGGRYEVTGTLAAALIEICVVTLEPFERHIEQPIELVFAPSAEPQAGVEGRGTNRRGRRARESMARESMVRDAVVSPPVPGSDDQVDPPDPIIDDTIDIGAVAVEFLTLARDPYPRKPAAQFEDLVTGGTDGAPSSAFAALAQLKDRS